MKATDIPANIRVGIADGLGSVHLTGSGGPVDLRVGSPRGHLIGRIQPGHTWTLTLRNGRFRVSDAAGRVIGVNTMVVAGGLALAIPSERVVRFLEQGSRPALGIAIRPVKEGLP